MTQATIGSIALRYFSITMGGFCIFLIIGYLLFLKKKIKELR
jgi:hypothetical protein